MKTKSGNERPEPIEGEIYWLKAYEGYTWKACTFLLGEFFFNYRYYSADDVYDFIHIPKPNETPVAAIGIAEGPDESDDEKVMTVKYYFEEKHRGKPLYFSNCGYGGCTAATPNKNCLHCGGIGKVLVHDRHALSNTMQVAFEKLKKEHPELFESPQKGMICQSALDGWHPKDWFISMIGQRIFRGPVDCQCEICKRVTEEGVIVQDVTHANSLYDSQNDLNIRYTSNK